MATINMRLQPDISATPLPNAFIDDYLPGANPAYTVLYIYCFRRCLQSTENLSTAQVAEALNMLESDVINGWKYWEKTGLVSLSYEGESLDVQFLQVVSKQKEAEQPETATRLSLIRPAVLESRPQYTVQELELYKTNSEEINRLFEGAEKILGKLLNYNDLSTLFGLYDWLRLPVEVIEELLFYCAENDHRSLRYIEKAALDWAENGISTLDAAREYVKTFNKDFREIMKAVGQSRRDPTKRETAYMKKWIAEYQMPLEVILEACDKTVMQLGGPKFSYTDKILTDWKEKGVKSLQDVQDAESKFFETKVEKPKKASKNRFVNYSQREWDYDKLEKMEMEYLEQSLKGN